MRLGRLAAATVLAAAAGLVVAACTSTTDGGGRTGGSTRGTSTDSSTGPSSGTGSTSGSTSNSGPSSSAPPTTLPADLLRAPVVTAIGDPGTADLCAAVGTDTFGALGVSASSTDPVQYPPGCSFTLSNASGAVLDVSVFAAARRQAPRADGRTKRTASGLDVYSYPFDPHTGGCPRDVLADNVRLVADAIARGSAQPDEQLSCSATDAMANRLAGVAAFGSVPRLSLAQPSVVSLNACAVVDRAAVTELSAFASGHLIRRGFAVNCEVRTEAVFLFINAALASTVPPPQSTPVSLAGHDLYQIASRSGFCSYASVQGTTGDGAHEEVTAAATVPAGQKAPVDLCDQTAQALARYLTTAGLG